MAVKFTTPISICSTAQVQSRTRPNFNQCVRDCRLQIWAQRNSIWSAPKNQVSFSSAKSSRRTPVSGHSTKRNSFFGTKHKLVSQNSLISAFLTLVYLFSSFQNASRFVTFTELFNQPTTYREVNNDNLIRGMLVEPTLRVSKFSPGMEFDRVVS